MGPIPFLFVRRRERLRRVVESQAYALPNPDKSRGLCQRSAVRQSGPLRRHFAAATVPAVDLVADDRADPVREAVRDGAHRQPAPGDAPGRRHSGIERHRRLHVLADIHERARQLREQQRELQQSPDAGQHRPP